MDSKTTNIKVKELNYNRYNSKKYDWEIQDVIPGYNELHTQIEFFFKKYSRLRNIKKIADLGAGTGVTSEKIIKIIPHAELTVIDFSENMLQGARQKLSRYNSRFILGDYSNLNFGKNFDVIISVIGIHHQTNSGKKQLFQKIFKALRKGGIFVFGDLVTYSNKYKASFNEAKHYAFLVKNLKDEKSLQEWAYRHKFLNDLAPLEDQLIWLKEAGFSKVDVKYEYFNTVLILAEK